MVNSLTIVLDRSADKSTAVLTFARDKTGNLIIIMAGHGAAVMELDGFDTSNVLDFFKDKYDLIDAPKEQ